jgi:hypothetical protein
VKFQKPNEQRNQVITALGNMRHQVELIMGAGEAARKDAETHLAKLELERQAILKGLDRVGADENLMSSLQHPAMKEVANWLGSMRAQFYADAASIPHQLRELVSRTANGSAGLPPGEWLGQAGSGHFPPELWKIGTAKIARSESSSVNNDANVFDVAVPLLDQAHLAISSEKAPRMAVDSLIEGLLLRVLSAVEPGSVRIYLWDIGQLTAVLPNLYPLTRTNAITTYDPTCLDDLLQELAGHVRRIHTNTMQAGFSTLRQMRQASEIREPWRIAVLYGNGEAWQQEALRDLKRIAGGAQAAGISLITVNVPTVLNGGAESIRFLNEKQAFTSMTGNDLVVDLDEPIPAPQVSSAAARLTEALVTKQGGPRTFADLLPAELGQEHSSQELRAPVGFYDGDPVEVVIGDSSPHTLIGGPSGSGKTNFLYALLGSLASRYTPDELALYLLDFKEGVSFAGLAPGRKDATWLPHARLVGVNINTDREFGLALLKFLTDELRRRSAAAKAHEVTNLSELRKADPTGHWPRIVAVIDEFQYLFAGRDSVTSQATSLLEDIARRGRSQGIHMILASQDVASIEAFWGKPAIFEQCTLRIAMPKARRVLATDNDAAVSAPKWHAVINHESGVKHGNQLAHIPDASSKDLFPSLQRELWELYADEHQRPRLFDGAHSPLLEQFPAFNELSITTQPRALVGQSIKVDEAACGVELSSSPGRNFAVLGNSVADALSIMDSSALSLARQYQPGEVEFVVNCPIERSLPAVLSLVEQLVAAGHRASLTELPELSAELTKIATVEDKVTKILLLYGVDAALPTLEVKQPGESKSGLDMLRVILKQGPSKGIHTIGWWRQTARLKDTLGYGSTDDIGAWTALDVQGNELNSFSAGQIINWSPRPGRAIFFDRSTHSRPEVIIPFQRPDREHS